MRMVGLGWFCLVLLLTGGGAGAQICPANLHPIDSSYGYRHRGGPDRCEGMYASPVAGESLEVLSFTSGRPQNDSGRSGPLFITAPDLHNLTAIAPEHVTASAPEQVIVVGRALPLRVYYRLDITLLPNGSAVWPVDQVVIPAGLKPDDIGLVGLVKTDETNIYVPLKISTDRSDVAEGVPKIVFRAPEDLDSFQWRLYAAGQNVPWQKKGAARAGDAITLSLSTRARASVITLEVAAKPVGGEYIQSRYKVFCP